MSFFARIVRSCRGLAGRVVAGWPVPGGGRILGAGALALALAGCGGPETITPAAVPSGPTPSASGEVIGSGSVTVALLLPLSVPGVGPSLSRDFKNAAALGVAAFPNADIRIIVKDDGGSDIGGRAAAQAAIGEGAKLILGPIFSTAVTGAASVARPANVPVIAFSTDSSVASRGVYLLSFLPQNDVERIVSYASSRGKTSFAALLPANGYGTAVEAAFREMVGRVGGRVVAIERFSPDGSDLAARAQAIAAQASSIDSLLVAENARGAVAALGSAGVGPGRIQLLGTGQWDDPSIIADPGFAGAWFAAPERAQFDDFAARYSARYGSRPPRIASLAYEATTLAAGLVRSVGPNAFTEPVLTNPEGFIGVNGLFRFMPNGINQRGLAVYEIGGGAARVVSPAPRKFTSGS